MTGTNYFHIGENLINNQELLVNCCITKNKILIVTDKIVADYYLSIVMLAIKNKNKNKNISVNYLILSSGEQYKKLESVTKIWEKLASLGFDRNSMLISLGGGVVGDITGFAAACYMRGISWLQIPTTLLAQVDAGLGGKTGINFGQDKNLAKNLIGAFHQPDKIICDINVLNSLDERNYVAGLAEVAKYGIACDREFFNWLEENSIHLRNRDKSAILIAVQNCCKIKMNIVDIDPKDNNIRKILNFGHTFAHAIEAATEFKQYLHGEAVAIGMAMATKLSKGISWLDNDGAQRVNNLLKSLSLPLSLDISSKVRDVLFDCMQKDKKQDDGLLYFVLPYTLGKVRVTSEIDEKIIKGLLNTYV